ncbi:M56 family metallopeptidase [Thiohalorhabdus denitrificans]|uniref:Zn-dependent protease with chaperone function n=1 Tax=Thiohalorhabdus denitrificans TaxID=381306 RepID=A0A1G5BZ29_9GAMM|nr:M56 family metallopeptidase [Thiohalorhabdus denitrificans]SCX95326.1 Zn-dependent protease with chaperone function [Thiohalorhabdus denitrificans]
MPSLILILAAVGLVAGAVAAALSQLVRPRVLGLLQRMPVEQQANLLLVWALLPLLAGLMAVAVVVAPSVSAALGLTADHCLLHGTHHSHLCLLHPGTTPEVPGAWALLGLLAAGLTLGGVYKVRVLERANRPWRTLRRVAREERQGPTRILETAQPVAATVGLLRPNVLFSRGLLDLLSPQQDRAVRAHEAAHRLRRDPLRLVLARLGTVLHLPGTGRALYRELGLAVERAADEAAARTVGDRVTVAEALLAVARMRPVPAPGPGFTGDPLEARVQALLEDVPAGLQPWRGTGSALVGLALAALSFSPQFHHGLETLLGHL